MMQDWIENFDDDDLIIGPFGGQEELQIVTKLILSFISKEDITRIKKRIPKIIEKVATSTELHKVKITESSFHPERESFVLIEFPLEFLKMNSQSFRILLWGLCKWLSAESISITVKSNDNLNVIYYLKDEIDFENVDFRDIFKDKYEETISSSSFEIKIEADILRKNKSFYLCKGLLIRNIDSDVVIPEETIDYARSIIDKAINNNNYIIPQPTEPIHHMMYYPEINPDIPILLKKKEGRRYKSYEDIWKDVKDNRKIHYIPKGGILGYYTKDSEDFCKGPHIVLDPEVICELSEDTKIPFKVLFTEVLIHELAHAIMDNSEDWPSSLEAKAMEESLANMITIEWFKEYAPEDEKYIKHFIDNWQSSIYKFGIWQEKIDAVWEKWRESTKQTTPKLEEWFNMCFAEGNIIIPIEDYTKEIYNKVFE